MSEDSIQMNFVIWNLGIETEIFIIMIIILLPSVFRLAGSAKGDAADLVLYGGTIYTVDEKNPGAEAVAIKGDRVIDVGSNDRVKKWISKKTRLIDLEGGTVVPGLIDCHGHMEWYGRSRGGVGLYDTKSYDEVLRRVKARLDTVKPGDWVFGGGWAETNWAEKKLLTHERLSRISPINPVWLIRADGHSALANAKAMELAGIRKEIRDPDGGEIIRDSISGEPTGIFVDQAMSLVTKMFPATSDDDRIRSILKAADDAASVGLTGIHDAGVSYEVIQIYKKLAEQRRLKPRIYAMLGGYDLFLDDYFKNPPMIGFADNHLTVRSIKIAIDGAMGSYGALLLKDYSDRKSHSGKMMRDPAGITSIAVDALRNGFQLNVHAIGDRGVRLALDILEQALRDFPRRDHRFRIEHVQLIDLNDIPRFIQLSIIPSMQPTHATSDMYWTEDRVGKERIQGNYAWRKILNTGSIIAGGSDFPIESMNPLWSIYSAITRQNHDSWPKEGWYPEERMSREEALKSFTLWAAYAAFEDNIKGSITPGKLADLVVFSKDIMKVPAKELLDTKALLTIVGGEIVFQDKSGF